MGKKYRFYYFLAAQSLKVAEEQDIKFQSGN